MEVLSAEDDSSTMQVSRRAIAAPDHVHELLEHLHELSIAQESTLNLSPEVNRSSHEGRLALDYVMRDKYIALDQDKCQFVYTLIRAIGATNVVEAGTSYGVSTIYLALAVGQNIKDGRAASGKVIATEHEPEKATVAKQHWSECGNEVLPYIDLREGDLLETLKKDLPQIDLLLLDIWTPLALPTLKLVLPKMRRGAIVVVDNTAGMAEDYADLLAVLHAPDGPFKSMTLPFTKGLELSTYLP